MPVPTPTLSYSTAPRRHWLRRHLRVCLCLCVIAFVGVIGWRYRDQISHRVRWVYWGYHCAHHVTPPGTVLSERDPQRMAALLAQNGDYVTDNTPRNVLPRMAHRLPPTAIYVPIEWQEFSTVEPQAFAFNPPLWGWEPINFLGERSSPDGKRWIVVLAGDNGNALSLPCEISSLVVPVPSLFDSLTQRAQETIYSSIGRYEQATYEPAVADGADRSHLSLPFQAGYADHVRHGIVDIHVQNDGTLRFALRDPATTRGL